MGDVIRDGRVKWREAEVLGDAKYVRLLMVIEAGN